MEFIRHFAKSLNKYNDFQFSLVNIILFYDLLFTEPQLIIVLTKPKFTLCFYC